MPPPSCDAMGRSPACLTGRNVTKASKESKAGEPEDELDLQSKEMIPWHRAGGRENAEVEAEPACRQVPAKLPKHSSEDASKSSS